MVKDMDMDKGEKSKKFKTDFDFTFVHPQLLESVQNFIEFRKTIKKPIKTQLQLQTLYDNLRELSGTNISKAKQIINNSIANGWQGIFAINEKPNYQKPSGEGMNIDELLKRQIA
jgi:hypothetical protein